MGPVDVTKNQTERILRLGVGCTFDLRASQPTSALTHVAVHPEQSVAIERESWDGVAAHHRFTDHFTNRTERIELPAGESRVAYHAEVAMPYVADAFAPHARELSAGEIPDHLLHWVLPSRYCESDELGNEAFERFGGITPGWSRVQAVCDHVHDHLDYVVGSSNPWTTSADVNIARQGVCRDYAHLAITFCRALTIPARYVFGYIPEVGGPIPDPEMDFSAWFEVFLEDRWYAFDARLNEPRTGRVVVGRGRDAVDVAMLTTFGQVELVGFSVHADELH